MKTDAAEWVEVVGTGVTHREAWKASSVARFWSIWTARLNQASRSISESRPVAMDAKAADICQLSPQQNLTIIVFGSVYLESYTRSQNWSR